MVTVNMPFRKKKMLSLMLIIPIVLVVTGITVLVDFDIKGHFDGIFLLKADNWKYVLKDDLYVGDTEHIVFCIDFDDPKFRIANALHQYRPGESHLYYEWDEKDGSGIVKNFMANGTVLFTSFGRLFDETHERVHGLFVGGTLPANILGNNNAAMNESGMAFYDGNRWYHIWCNVNEAIYAFDSRGVRFPSRWTFLGSKVIDKSNNSLVISSYHQTEISGVPLQIQRIVYLFANEPYFVLSMNIKNIGTQPVSFYYVYGDEPWVGDYGSSRGNVGWVRDRIINYETSISPQQHSYAGLYQYGNEVINEGHDFSKMANFIEWFGNNLPYQVYFSNVSGLLQDPTGEKKLPLSSTERSIGVGWRITSLQPSQTYNLNIAVGMAGHDSKTDMPIKPSIEKAFR
jgi:hypothetical protein